MLKKKGKQIIAYALVFCMLLTLPGFTSSASETKDTQHTETETETSAETESLEEGEKWILWKRTAYGTARWT